MSRESILLIYLSGNGPNWARSARLPTSASGGGRNHENHDYARTRCAVEPPVWVRILVCIREGIVPLLHGRAPPVCVSDCERNPSLPLSSLLLSSFL